MSVVGYLDGYIDENNNEYGLTDTVAQNAITAIKDGTTIDSFSDVETVISGIKDGTTIDSFGDVETALADKADASDVTAIEGKIPSGASSSNKMATASDVASRVDWSANAVLGAKNIVAFPYENMSPQTLEGVTFTKDASNGIININGSTTGTPEIRLSSRDRTGKFREYEIGKTYTASLGVDLEANNLLIHLGTTKNGAYSDIVTAYTGKEVTFTLTSDMSDLIVDNKIPVAFYITCGQGSGTKTYDNLKVYPMIRLAEDTDDTWVAPAMTNQQLTDAVTIEDITSDFATFAEGISYGDDKSVYKIGKLIVANIVLKKTGNWTQGTFNGIMTINSKYRPAKNINGVCHFSVTEWGDVVTGGYMWLTANDGSVNVKQPSNTAQAACKVSICYVTS